MAEPLGDGEADAGRRGSDERDLALEAAAAAGGGGEGGGGGLWEEV